MLKVLLQATTDSQGSDGGDIVLGAIVFTLFIGVLIYFRWSSKQSKKEKDLESKPEDHPFEEHLENPGEIETIMESSQNTTPLTEQVTGTVVETTFGPGDYEVDPKDANFFVSKRIKEFSIRIISSKKDYDVLVFTTSWPCVIDAHSHFRLRALIPGLSEISTTSHEISLRKSPGAMWSESTKDQILRFTFEHLYNAYKWKFEKQIIIIKRCPNPDALSFHSRIQTKFILDLGRKLFIPEGIITEYDGHPLCMDHDRRYEFSLIKAETYSWEEIFPKIKKIIEDYFPAGVEFQGYDPSPFTEAERELHTSKYQDVPEN